MPDKYFLMRVAFSSAGVIAASSFLNLSLLGTALIALLVGSCEIANVVIDSFKDNEDVRF